MVLDLGAEDLESVEIGGQRVADGREIAAFGSRDLASRVGGRVRGAGFRRRQLLGEPPPALREGMWERDDGADVGEPDPGRRAQVERDREVDLPLDEQVAVE